MVHFFEHPTSRPTTMSTQGTMVDPTKKKHSPHSAAKYLTSMNHSAPRHHQLNQGNDSIKAESVQAFEEMRSW
jgi:hypothetical protein